ncbi:MAG TPA: hypothetical protein VGN04_12135 [Herbaspirillum sp.]
MFKSFIAIENDEINNIPQMHSIPRTAPSCRISEKKPIAHAPRDYPSRQDHIQENSALFRSATRKPRRYTAENRQEVNMQTPPEQHRADSLARI